MRKDSGWVRDVFQQKAQLSSRQHLHRPCSLPTAGADSAQDASPSKQSQYGICLGPQRQSDQCSRLTEVLGSGDRRHLTHRFRSKFC